MSIILLSVTSIVSPVDDCVNDIVAKTVIGTDKVLFLNNFYSQGIPQFLHNFQNWNGFEMQTPRFDVYMGTVEEHQLNASFYNLSLMKSWNSRGKFVLSYSGNLDAIFEVASKYFVYNIVVVRNMTMYTYFPYSNECVRNPNLVPIVLGRCEVDLNLFPEKLPRLWRNTTLRVAYVTLAPYVVFSGKSGIDISIMETIVAPYLGVKLEYQRVGWFGMKKNESYTDTYGAIYSKQVDCGIGCFRIHTEDEYYDFDTTPSYMEETVHWMVHRAEETEHWQRLLHSFQPLTWACSIATHFFLTLAWIIFGKYSKGENPYYKVTLNAATISLCYFLEQHPPHHIHTKCTRLLFICTFVFVFIMNAVWNSQVYYALTHNTYKHQVDSLHEIVEQQFRIAIPMEDALNIYNNNPTYGKYIYENNEMGHGNDPEFEKYFTNIAEFENLASLSSVRSFNYMLDKFKKDQDGYPLAHLQKTAFTVEHVVLVFTKGHPCVSDLDQVILRATSGGLVEEIVRSLEHKIAIKRSNVKRFNTKPLSLRKVDDIFFLYLIGCGISFIWFCTEVTVVKYSVDKKKVHHFKRGNVIYAYKRRYFLRWFPHIYLARNN